MHPFNRQHNSRLRSKNSSDRHERVSSEDRKYEDGPLGSELFSTRTVESSPLPLRRSLPRDQDILRAKEKVLVGSLSQGSCSYDADNSRRLGPNTQNIFDLLTNTTVRNNRNAERSRFDSNLIGRVESIALNTGGYKSEFNKDVFERNRKAGNENTDRKSKELKSEDSISKGSENNYDGKICYSPHSSENFGVEGKLTIECNGSVQETNRNISSEAPCSGYKEESKAESSSKVYSPSSYNLEEECHLLNCKETDSEGFSSTEMNHNIGENVGGSAGKLCSPPRALLDHEEIDSGEPALISYSTAVPLKEVILGSAFEVFSPQWMDQSFTFNTHRKLLYGFVQKRGGACGVLAAVQAFLLKSLLFELGACAAVEPLRPTSSEAQAGLARAVAHILWRAGDEQAAVLATPSGSAHLTDSAVYRRDGLTETLVLQRFSSRAALEKTVRRQQDHFSSSGCLLVVVSAVLSRGVRRTREDMDEPTALIGPNGHCVQELVNLLLTGRACSNVFDDTVRLDECTLTGVHCRAEVGFLSLFEHYNSCQVGSYLKTPQFPVWVVCSDSHFTVLFSCRKELVHDPRAERHFHLYHYDGMARLEDEVKLTVDTTGLAMKKESREHTPPLEHCIRTKWKDAAVDWNSPYLAARN